MRMTPLAIEGGNPVRADPAPPWPQFEPDEIAAASAPLRSGKVNYWTGDLGKTFEQACAARMGVRHGIALANGSVALELALRVLDIGPGDDVVVPCRSFVASASCVVLCGARPVFADIDADSQNITAETVSAVLTPRSRAIIAVHLAGWPCDMDALVALARDRGLYLIEDCAQCHGATWRGRVTGSFGDVNAFSFCQDKILTTAGEGGLLVTDRADLSDRAWSFKDHGKSRAAMLRNDHPPGFRWVHESIGTNWRLSEIQAAVGLAQLAKLDRWLAARRRNASRLARLLAEVPGLRVPVPPEHAGHAYYRFYAFLDLDRLRPGWDQPRVIASIAAEGIPCSAGSCAEIYREKAFVDAGLVPARPLPVARALGKSSIALLVHPTLADHDIDLAAAAVAKVMAHATD